MRWIIFSRVSTKMQTIANQIAECEKYVDENVQEGDEVIRFEEPDTSSRIPMLDREKLQEMLNFTQKGDTLVIYKLDRLARDGEELVYIYRNRLIKRGVHVISLYEPHIDNANIHIYAFLGETERNNVRIRTKSGLQAKKARGEKVGSVLYGYKTDETKLQTERENCHSYNKPYLLIPDENEKKQVDLMMRWHDAGLSYGEIARRLEREGHLNRSGKPVQKMTVYRVNKREKTTCQNVSHRSKKFG